MSDKIGEPTQGLQLCFKVVDILLCRYCRVGACLEGILLGRQPKCIPADGVENIEALHALVPGNDICGRVPLYTNSAGIRPERVTPAVCASSH